jgi:S1-C subfamily serine protease
MILMVRGLVVGAALCSLVVSAAGQELSVLHIRVVLVNADRKPMPVARHALLVSDNPATSTPRRIVTAADGTADVRLRPGNYTVESDLPLAFEGKAYEWTQNVDVVAGRDSVLELTADNAAVGPVTATATSIPSAEADPSSLLAQWEPSVVALWTPTAYGSGFVIGADGLLVTSQRTIGATTSVEVQLTPTVKVAGKILAADAARDVAVLWIDPMIAASVPSVPLGCGQAAKPSVTDGQKIFTIEAPLHQPKSTTSGTVSRVAEHEIESDLFLAGGSTGGPVFTVDGVIGITTAADDNAGRRRGNSRVVRIDDVCGVVGSARQKTNGAAPPGGTRLPVEPERPFPADALKDAAQRRMGSLMPYQTSSSSFDLAFMTPVLTYGAQARYDQASRQERSTGTRGASLGPALERLLMDFGSWSQYVADFPPVLLVRVTPKLVEGFWTKVARGAAQTQGVAIPPIKRFTSGFSRMRAFCGDAEVTPIHPFKLERRVSETEAIYEGLYVFDPAALAPSCSSVKLMLYTEKEPDKGDTLLVDARVIQQIWQDFEPYRAVK